MAKNARLPNGLYRYWYKGKQFYGKTDAEARKKRDDYKYECEHGIEQQLPITVVDYVEQWLPVAKASVKKRTYNEYVTCMERMTQTIGNKLVSAVTPADIKKVWAKYADYSDSVIKRARHLYTSMFESAVANGYCRTNPMRSDDAQPHKGPSGTHRVLEQWEIDLINRVDHRCRPAAMFMLYAGLRRGEVLALNTSNISNEYITVTDAVIFDSNKPVVDTPKTDSSIRKVPLFAPLKPLIDGLDYWVLPDEHGNLCSETAFRRAWQSYITDLETELNGCHKRWWHLTKDWIAAHPAEHEKYITLKSKSSTRSEAEIYRLRGWKSVNIRPHDLRHTFVTMCRDKGVDLHVCMKWCGHSSEKMILRIYDHVSTQREQNAIAVMDSGTVKKQLKPVTPDPATIINQGPEAPKTSAS